MLGGLFIGVGRKSVGIAALNGLFAVEDLCADFLVNGSRSSAIFAAAVGLYLGTDVLVALACEHVLNRLRADELAGRGDEGRIAHVLAHARSLDERFLKLVQCVHHLQLAEQVREHAAGDLIGKALSVGGHGDGVECTVGEVIVADGLEEVCHFYEYLLVKRNIVAKLFERIVKRLGRRLRGAAGEGGYCGVDNVRAGLNALEVGHERKTGGAVRVQNDGQVNGVLDAGNEVVCALRSHDAGHVLYADRAYAHLL